MNSKTIIAYLGILALFFASCANDFPGYDKNETGLYYKFHVQSKSGDKPKEGDYVVVKNVITVRKDNGDSIVFDSREAYPQNGGTVQYLLNKPAYPGALEDGLTMMSVGDSASFLVSSDSLDKYYPTHDSTARYKKGTMLVFEIKLVEIKSKEQVMKDRQKMYEEMMAQQKLFMDSLKVLEKGAIEKYLEQNKISEKPDKNGIYLYNLSQGKGKQAKAGDLVTVKYKGMFLNGQIFDASEMHDGQPFQFTIGKGQVVKGWDEGIQKLKVGGKGTILLPSAMAYDSNGVPDQQSGRYAIPPYTPLVFEVELVEVK